MLITTLASTSADGTTLPQQTEEFFGDGRSARTYGALYPASESEYLATGAGVTSKSYLLDGTTRMEYSQVDTDLAGQVISSSSSANGTSQIYHDTAGRVSSIVDQDGLKKIFEYDELGQMKLSYFEQTVDSLPNYGSEQVSFSQTRAAVSSSAYVVRNTQKVWKPDAAESAGTVTEYNDTTPDGLQSWHTTLPLAVNGSSVGYGTVHSVTVLDGGGVYHTLVTAADQSQRCDYYADGKLMATTFWASGASVPPTCPANITAVSAAWFVSGTSYTYDDQNRLQSSTHSRTGTTQYTYDKPNSDLIVQRTDPNGYVALYFYDERSRVTEIRLPGYVNSSDFAHAKHTSCNVDGALAFAYGGGEYPTWYYYDYAKRLSQMKNAGNPAKLTTWNYVGGRLSTKVDALGKATTYTYTAAGRLRSREWARHAFTRYDYDKAGRLMAQRYFISPNSSSDSADHLGGNAGNDSSTPDIVYNYDSVGRVTSVSRGGATHFTFGYDSNSLRLLSETQNDVDFGQRYIQYKADPILRTTGYRLGTSLGGAEVHETTYAYDSAGRFGSLAYLSARPGSVQKTFTWGYQYDHNASLNTDFGSTSGAKNSDLPFTISRSAGGSAFLTTQYAYEDSRNILHSVVNSDGSGNNLSQQTYANAKMERLGVTNISVKVVPE